MYSLMQSLLFTLPPEAAHRVAMGSIDAAAALHLTGLFPRPPSAPVKLWKLEFPNLGFGFIEIGTVTPRPQPGNPKPRLFRLRDHDAIINRMGFNNLGVDHLVERVRARRYQGVLGINIGKNATTPVENAVDDYLACLERVYPVADYVAVNISSPNTEGLRSLQYGDELKRLLEPLKRRQAVLAGEHGKQSPLLVKIAPDLSDEEVASIAGIIRNLDIDGVIATNTTISRDRVAGSPHAEETGGLSGPPVREASTHVIRTLYAELGEDIPIIGVGGISDGASALEKIEAGARLVQIYTGFIYRGPALVTEAVKAIAAARA